MNTDNLRTLVRNTDSDLFELINHVICSICQELLTKPVTTPCGHSFCSACIKRVVSSKDNSGCPLCKNPVKRYCLETDNVKSTLTEIFRELPAAFEKDVQELSAVLNDTTEDLLKNSKLAQLSGQDYEKDVKGTKRKTSVSKKSQKLSNKSQNPGANDNDVDSFVPVLKRSKNVIEYASAKKKKMDDLISISQREVELDSGVCDTSGLDKKLEQIEKVSPEEKINEWFKAVGSNIYLSSPGSNYFDLPPTKNLVEGQSFSKDTQEGDDADGSAMIRKEFKKVTNPLHSKENEKEVVNDPYEFVPSQSKKIVKRRGRKCLEKKLPDFKAIQSFTKESLKRNAIILNEQKKDDEIENEEDVSLGNDKFFSEFPAVATTPDMITASQKFDKLLLETKENEKKGNVKAHVLYSASQASSTEFLDCSYHSPLAEVKKVPKRRKSGVSFMRARKSSSKQESSNSVPSRTRFPTKCLNPGTKTEECSERSERKHSLNGDEARADERQSFSEIMNLRSEEAFDLEKSVEDYLMKFKKDKPLKKTSGEKSSQPTKTTLTVLLEELINDDVVHKNRPGNTPVVSKNQRKGEEKDSEVNCKKIPQQTKTKLIELLGELVNDDVVYKNYPRNSPVEMKNHSKAKDKEKDSKVSSCEKTSQQTKTKLHELLEELVNDDAVYKNHPRNTPVEVKNQSKAKDKEKDSKVNSCEKTSQQTKTKLHELLEELVNDDTVYKNHPRNSPVEVKNQSKAVDKDKDSKVSSCEKTSQPTKTKLVELLEEVVNDDTVLKNHLQNSSVEVKNQSKAKDKEKDSKVNSCEKTSQQTKTKLHELLEELVNDDTVYKNYPRNSPVAVKNQIKAKEKEKDPKLSSCEKTSQKTKTKFMELLEEVVNDDTVLKNHLQNSSVEVKNQSKAEDKEKDSKVNSCEKTSQQTKTKLHELLEELVNDDAVYKNHPRNCPVEVKNQSKAEDKEKVSCEKTSQQTKTKLHELLEELVNDDTVYKNNPRNSPVEVKNQSKAVDKDKDSKVSSCEKTSQQAKTKLHELLEELVNDDTVYKNHPKSSPVKVKSQSKAEDKEKDSKVSSCEKTSQQAKTKLMELLEEVVNDDTVLKNHLQNSSVEVNNQSKAEDKEKDSKVVSSCEKTSQQTKTKLMELLEEVVNDDTVYKNHPRNSPVEVKNQSKVEDKEKDSKVVSSCEKTSQQTKTKLHELLEELVNDDIVYKNHPKSSPVKVKKRRKAEVIMENTSHRHQNIGYNSNSSGSKETSKLVDDLKSGKLYTQGTHLLGFSTQEELVHERMFKEMVKNMEKELELSESDLKRTPLEQSNEERDGSSPLNSSYDNESPSSNSNLAKNELGNSSFIRFDCLGEIRKKRNYFIKFLRLGRLNPTVKRSRSSVVKLVFPIGFSSFARRRGIQDQLPTRTNFPKPLLSDSPNSSKDEICVPSSRIDHISTGIQTSQKLVSSAEIQTSHLSKSVVVQTSQVINPSVEIQTVKESCCAGIQTSQMPTPEKSRIYKSAQIQTSQIESSPLLKDNPNDMETEYIPGSVDYDEPEILPNRNIARGFEEPGLSFGKLKSSKNRTCSLENEMKEFSSRASTKRKSLSPAKKHFHKHRKISSRKREKGCSPESGSPDKAQDGTRQDKLSNSSLTVDSEMKREFYETWVRKSQEDLIERKNKRNRGEEEAISKELEISSPAEKKLNSSLTQNLSGLIDEVLQKFETRQRIPLDVRKVSTDDDCEMIDLATPESVQQNSQEQIIQVLKNIDLDLKGRGSKKGNGRMASMNESCTKGEKSDESDSDFFVEQTPPRPSNSRLADQEPANSSKFDGRGSHIENVEKEENKEKRALNSQGSDLIGDSLPKDLPETESFLMVTTPQKVLLTPEKKESNNVSYLEKRGKSGSQSFPKEKSFSTIQKLENFPKANENDQNQLNAASETKSNQVKTWIKAEESPHVKTRQKFYIVASSVKNLDMIKKFVVKFKMEYSNKPSKSMTHLIVGLHESEEEGDVLPLCTPKLLFAMANKKWIVSEAWAETCLKMDVIVPEENFEALDPVGGQGCRKARLSTQPLLRDCEIYLLGNFQTISKEDFAGLILDCGGTVIQKPEQFSFSPLKLRMIVADQDCLNMDKNQLQELHEKYSTVILSRDVILMSIQSYKLANFVPHLLHPTSEEELLKIGYPSQLVKSEEEDSSSSSSSNWNNSK